MSDVRLENGQVEIDGTLAINGPDLKLDLASRRKADNTAEHRRALVHGFEDELVINFNNDFKGVVIKGNKEAGIELEGQVFVNGKNLEELLSALKRTIEFLSEDRSRVYAALNRLERNASLDTTKKQKPVTFVSNVRLDVPFRPFQG